LIINIQKLSVPISYYNFIAYSPSYAQKLDLSVPKYRRSVQEDFQRLPAVFDDPSKWFAWYDTKKTGLLQIEDAVIGIMKTFKLPKYQKSSLKRLLRKRWG
jgi:hypothetical protein